MTYTTKEIERYLEGWLLFSIGDTRRDNAALKCAIGNLNSAEDGIAAMIAREGGTDPTRDEVSKLRAVIQHAKDIWPSSDWNELNDALG